jgi:ATP-dependent DNA helicase RecG
MQVEKDIQNSSVRYLKGVGPGKAVYFEKLGIRTIYDIFHYLPRKYEDRRYIVSVRDVKIGENQAVFGEVLKTGLFTARTGRRIFEISVGDGKKRIYAVWYNQPFLKKVFKPGQKVVLFGKIELQRRLQMTHPVFDFLSPGSDLKKSLEIGRIVPVYPLTENITQKYIRKIIYNGLNTFLSGIQEWLPASIMARRKLVDNRFALENIHFPHAPDNIKRAYKRLVFEEFFMLQLVLALKREKMRQKGIRHDTDKISIKEFESLFDFDFTGAQKKCIRDIEKDMSAEKPMHRLVQGDVGSGKTVLAIYALLVAVKNGYQAAIMAPTEILARQHFMNISEILMPMGINVQFLAKMADKKTTGRIKNEIRSGEIDIIVGTHALIQEGVEYNKLGLVVVDEQHKFGVLQRDALKRKGLSPDMLVMTATPIPRSLVLTFFGDMDVSMLREKPSGRQSVSTYWVREDQRQSVYAFIREEVSSGRQAFIVCPRVKDKNAGVLRSVEQMYKQLKDTVFNDLRVAMLHGKIKTAEKEQIMKDFRDSKYDILIATTVVEVGVDVPNATVMMIEHAEMFGLAQLHQLRGRIGRGKYDSYCILLGDPATDEAVGRLSAISDIEDGFKIAEKDLDIRGPGEFLGTKQSGLPEIRIGDIAKDFDVMEQAREEAKDIVEKDSLLQEYNHKGIKRNLLLRFRRQKV